MTATTLDPNNKSNQTLSGGNLVATSSGQGAAMSSRRISGLTYGEAVITTLTGTPSIGFGTGSYVTSSVQGINAQSLAYRPSGVVVINNVTVATIAAYAQGNQIDWAIDTSLQQVWFRVNNGNWNNNAANNPATGVGGIDYTSMNSGSSLMLGVFATLTGTVWTTTFSTPFVDTAPAGFSSLDAIQIVTGDTVFPHDGLPVVAPDFSLVVGRGALAYEGPPFTPVAGIGTLVSGTVDENGALVQGRVVEVYDRDTGELIGRTTSAADGSWSVYTRARRAVRIISSDPTVFNSLAFDNVVPV